LCTQEIDAFQITYNFQQQRRCAKRCDRCAYEASSASFDEDAQWLHLQAKFHFYSRNKSVTSIFKETSSIYGRTWRAARIESGEAGFLAGV
jgi:hypothetical protein